MSFCTNCGTILIKNSKFCPACGANVLAAKIGDNPLEKHSKDNGLVRKIVPKPERGRANNLFKEKAQDFIKEKAQGFIKENAKGFVSKNISKSENSEIASELNVSNNKTNKAINKWTWLYIIMNVILVLLGSQSEEVIGVLIFSVVVLGIVFFRIKTAKPYNWFVKIILVIQLILLVALIAESVQYISIFTLVFMGLLLTNLAVLFKGNNS